MLPVPIRTSEFTTVDSVLIVCVYSLISRLDCHGKCVVKFSSSLVPSLRGKRRTAGYPMLALTQLFLAYVL